MRWLGVEGLEIFDEGHKAKHAFGTARISRPPDSGHPEPPDQSARKNCFQNKDKRIAIMSEVASTGDSFHASRKARNRQRRLHIAAELKWSADKQVQDFGRTHRTGQVAPPIYLLVFTELGSRYKIVPKSRARAWWQDEQRKIPPTEQKTVHLLSGALLPIWKNLKILQQNGLNIVRTTTDEGVRLVGVKIADETINEIRRAFGIWKCAAGTAEEIIRAVRDEHEIIELLGQLKIRRTRFQGTRLIEICPNSYEQIRELRETALVNIIQNSRNRFFLSEDEKQARETLEKVLRLHPPLHLLKNAGEAVFGQNTTKLESNHQVVSLPEWLIEPPNGEVERILIKN